MVFLEIKNLVKTEQNNSYVNNVSFEQKFQEKLAIVGATGSGKTTLLKMIAGLIQATSGIVYLNAEKIVGPLDKLIPGHKNIGYLSQHFHLLNNYKVFDLLERSSIVSKSEQDHIFKICDIQHLLQRKTNELSGGERQRIALALQLITKPKLLLLDEPYSNLDLIHKNEIKSVINEVIRDLQLTCILISHDPLDVLSWADRIIVLKDGLIVQEGSAMDVYHTPKNEYVAALMGDYNTVDLNEMLTYNFTTTEFTNVFIRSEQILVKPYLGKGLKAIVNEVIFFGSYFIYIVLYKNQSLKVRSNDNKYVIGDELEISFNLNSG